MEAKTGEKTGRANIPWIRNDKRAGAVVKGAELRFTAGSDAISLRGHKPKLPRRMGAPVACSNIKLPELSEGAQLGVLF